MQHSLLLSFQETGYRQAFNQYKGRRQQNNKPIVLHALLRALGLPSDIPKDSKVSVNAYGT